MLQDKEGQEGQEDEALQKQYQKNVLRRIKSKLQEDPTLLFL